MNSKISAITAAVFLSALSLTGADAIFDLSFDDYTVTPQTAGGSKNQKGFTEPDLQLRMYPGVNGKGNALNQSNSEMMAYDMKGNFNPKEGTIILWMAPHNWKISNPEFQLFFYASQDKYNFRIAKTSVNYISATITYGIPFQGKKSFGTTVKARVEPLDWKAGRYHQVAVTWNREQMNLYIDGKKPAITPLFIGSRRVPPTVPVQKYSSPVDFPEARGKMHIGGNIWAKKHTLPEHSTAFDRITVYNEVLSADQIRAEYEKIIPPPKGKIENVLSIPKLKGNDKPAGDLSDPVWQKAAKVPLMPIMDAPAGNLSALIWYDDKNLHVGFSSDIPCQKKNYTGRDEKIWEDDVFEFHLRTAEKNHYQYIINGNGAIFDKLNGKTAWNGNEKAAVSHNEKGWTAELVIPLSDFNATEFDGEFCAASRPGLLYHTYRWGDNSRHFGPAGKMSFTGNSDTFRLDNLGNTEYGELNISGFSSNEVQLKITADGQQPQIYSAGKGKFSITGHLQSGRQHLEISGKGIFWGRDMVVRHPMSLTFDFLMTTNELNTQVDFSSSDKETRNQLEKSGFDVQLQLKDPNGKIVSSKTFNIRGNFKIKN